MNMKFENMTTIDLIKFVREHPELKCKNCGKSFKDVVWFIDFKEDENGIEIKNKGKGRVYVVCCDCGAENDLLEIAG